MYVPLYNMNEKFFKIVIRTFLYINRMPQNHQIFCKNIEKQNKYATLTPGVIHHDLQQNNFFI